MGNNCFAVEKSQQLFLPVQFSWGGGICAPLGCQVPFLLISPLMPIRPPPALSPKMLSHQPIEHLFKRLYTKFKNIYKTVFLCMVTVSVMPNIFLGITSKIFKSGSESLICNPFLSTTLSSRVIPEKRAKPNLI